MDSLLVLNVSAIETIDPMDISFKLESIEWISLLIPIILLAIDSEIRTTLPKVSNIVSIDCISLDKSMIVRLMFSALFIIISIEIVFKLMLLLVTKVFLIDLLLTSILVAIDTIESMDISFKSVFIV